MAIRYENGQYINTDTGQTYKTHGLAVSYLNTPEQTSNSNYFRN